MICTLRKIRREDLTTLRVCATSGQDANERKYRAKT
jgi:hypothetical protein